MTQPAPSSTPRNTEATRQKLLTAGARLFPRHGFEGCTTDRLAREAGVNKAMISYHFGGKRGLYGAVLVSGFATLREAFGSIPGPEADPRDRLAAFVRTLFANLRRRPEIGMLLLREQMSGAPNLDDEVVRELGRFFAMVQEILTAGEQRGIFRATDPHATHLSLVGSLVFFLATAPARERYGDRDLLPAAAPDPEAYGEHVVRLLLDGLCTPSTSAPPP